MLKSDLVIDFSENYTGKTQKNFLARIHEQLMIQIELQATQHGILIKIIKRFKINLSIEIPFEIFKISPMFLEMRRFYMIKLKRLDILKSVQSLLIVTLLLSKFELKIRRK